MTKKRENELIEWFENNDFGSDFHEAEKRGEVFFCQPGESPLEAAIKRRMDAKKKVHVGMSLPLGVVDKVKKQAAVAGIPWTSYIGAIVERAVAEPQTLNRALPMRGMSRDTVP